MLLATFQFLSAVALVGNGAERSGEVAAVAALAQGITLYFGIGLESTMWLLAVPYIMKFPHLRAMKVVRFLHKSSY